MYIFKSLYATFFFHLSRPQDRYRSATCSEHFLMWDGDIRFHDLHVMLMTGQDLCQYDMFPASVSGWESSVITATGYQCWISVFIVHATPWPSLDESSRKWDCSKIKTCIQLLWTQGRPNPVFSTIDHCTTPCKITAKMAEPQFMICFLYSIVTSLIEYTVCSSMR